MGLYPDNGLLHLISIHAVYNNIWMTFNECPGRCFEPCPGESKIDFNEGKGIFGANLILSRG